MKIEKKTLGKLSFLLPVMMALTSCSSLGTMQGMHTATGQGAHVKPHVHHTVSHKANSKIQIKSPAVSSDKPHAHAQVAQSTQIKKPSAHTNEVVRPKVMAQPNEVEIVEYVPPVKQTLKPQKPMPSKPLSKPLMITSPIEGQLFLLSVHGVDLQPHKYQKMDGRSIVKNIKRLDAESGDYHFVQVARWDGTHVDQTLVNARTAALLSLIGLGLMENGYIETNFGTVIMVFAGNGYIADIPGHKFQVQLNAAGAGKGKQSHMDKPRKKKHSSKVKHFIDPTPSFDSNDFYIQGNKFVTVKSKHHSVKSAASFKQVSKKTVSHQEKAIQVTDHQFTPQEPPSQFCHVGAPNQEMASSGFTNFI